MWLNNLIFSLLIYLVKMMSMEFDVDIVFVLWFICMKRCEGGYGFNFYGEKYWSG